MDENYQLFPSFFMIPARQEAVIEKNMKLDYEEITPCLKEVTKQWDKLIAIPNRANTIIPYEEINKLFKEGKNNF